MAKRQFHLNEQEIAQLRRAEALTRDIHEFKRLQATRLYGSGVAVTKILEVVGCGASSVRQWAMAYNADGVAGLRSHWKGGNANKLTAPQRAHIKERLHQYRPVDLHLSQGQYWTISDLRVALEQWYGVVYKHRGGYHSLLHACGFSYQRTAKIYRSKPSAAVVEQFESELEKK